MNNERSTLGTQIYCPCCKEVRYCSATKGKAGFLFGHGTKEPLDRVFKRTRKCNTGCKISFETVEIAEEAYKSLLFDHWKLHSIMVELSEHIKIFKAANDSIAPLIDRLRDFESKFPEVIPAAKKKTTKKKSRKSS